MFHDVPLEKNLSKLTGVEGDIASFQLADLPPLKSEFPPSVFCPAGTPPIPTKAKSLERLKEAVETCKAEFLGFKGIILEFWQDDPRLLQETLRILDDADLSHQIAAWGSPESTQVQRQCVEARPEIPIILTLAQGMQIFLLWALGILPFLPLSALGLPSAAPVVFNVPAVGELWPSVFRKIAGLEENAGFSVKGVFIELLCMGLRALTHAPKLVAHLRRRGIPTVLFLANTETDMNQCSKAGPVVAIQTDFPCHFSQAPSRKPSAS